MSNTTNTPKPKPVATEGADPIVAAANARKEFQLETLNRLEAIEETVTDRALYEADSLDEFGAMVWADQGRLGNLRDAHGTLALVGLMRRFHTTDGVLWGQNVTQVKVAESFGSFIDAKGEKKLNVPKGRINKALKLASQGVIAELLGKSDDAHGVLVAFLEERQANGQGISIETLWNEQFAKPAGAQTLSKYVASLLAWAEGENIDHEAVVAEVLHQISESKAAAKK